MTANAGQGAGGTALVLTGGGARGAYEVGALRYVYEQFGPGTRGFDIFAGTSVGALNASFLAAMAHDSQRGIADLVAYWRSLTMERVLEFGARQLLGLRQVVFGPPPEAQRLGLRHGRPPDRPHPPVAGVFSIAPLKAEMATHVPWDKIGAHLRAGRLAGVALCATELCTGQAVVFYESAPGVDYGTGGDPARREQAVHIGLEHAIASAAIPFLFPAQQIDGVCYVDGGMRQNTPLGPAIRFGADKLLVVSLSPDPAARYRMARLTCRRTAFPGLLFLLGRTVSSVIDGVLDQELKRIQMFNELLANGTAQYGPGFRDHFNATTLPHRGARYRPIQVLHLRPSRSLAQLAAEAMREAPAEARLPGVAGELLHRLLTLPALIEADLAGYVLFTPSHIRRLMELGYADAAARRDEIRAFLEA